MGVVLDVSVVVALIVVVGAVAAVFMLLMLLLLLLLRLLMSLLMLMLILLLLLLLILCCCGFCCCCFLKGCYHTGGSFLFIELRSHLSQVYSAVVVVAAVDAVAADVGVDIDAAATPTAAVV